MISFIGHSFAADQQSESKTNKPRTFINALRVDTPPVIDGNMDDEVWKKAPVSSPFEQHEPVEGVPMTERTEFRVLYDEPQRQCDVPPAR